MADVYECTVLMANLTEYAGDPFSHIFPMGAPTQPLLQRQLPTTHTHATPTADAPTTHTHTTQQPMLQYQAPCHTYRHLSACSCRYGCSSDCPSGCLTVLCAA